MTFLLAINALICGFLGVIWGRKDVGNALLKIVLIVLALWNLFQLVIHLGYVVKL